MLPCRQVRTRRLNGRVGRRTRRRPVGQATRAESQPHAPDRLGRLYGAGPLPGTAFMTTSGMRRARGPTSSIVVCSVSRSRSKACTGPRPSRLPWRPRRPPARLYRGVDDREVNSAWAAFARRLRKPRRLGIDRRPAPPRPDGRSSGKPSACGSRSITATLRPCPAASTASEMRNGRLARSALLGHERDRPHGGS